MKFSSACHTSVKQGQGPNIKRFGALCMSVSSALLLTNAAPAQASEPSAYLNKDVSAQQLVKQLNIELSQSSVSGLSSGGYMATQLQLAHSENIVGAGIVGAGPYYCALGDIAIALGQCVGKASSTITNAPFIEKHQQYQSSGKVADAKSLSDDKVLLIHGILDKTVNRTAADLLAAQYQQWLPEENLRYINDKAFGHHMPSADYGTQCSASESPYIGKCGFDAAGEILQFIYGELQGPNTDYTNAKLRTFDISSMIDLSGSSIADDAFIYIPDDCAEGQSCRLHLSFHGCNQSEEFVGDSYAQHAGFNQWADSNAIVVLYPQIEKSMFMPLNPQGCWDWWGYTDENYANKDGVQIQVMHQLMLSLSGDEK